MNAVLSPAELRSHKLLQALSIDLLTESIGGRIFARQSAVVKNFEGSSCHGNSMRINDLCAIKFLLITFQCYALLPSVLDAINTSS